MSSELFHGRPHDVITFVAKFGVFQLPEQYRLDPPVPCGQHHHQHKKKKHKHRYLEKVDEASVESYPSPGNRDRSPPVDPCSFIHTEHTTNFFHQAPPSVPTTHHTPPMIPVMGTQPMKFMGAANILSQQPMAAPTTPSVIVDRLPPSMPGLHVCVRERACVCVREREKGYISLVGVEMAVTFTVMYRSHSWSCWWHSFC